MPALIHHTEPAPAVLPPDWSGVGGCSLPVAAGPTAALLSCHALILTTGPLLAEIDFAEHLCRPGTLLWIRPGQAVRFAEPVDEPAAIVFRPGLFGAAELPGLSPDGPAGPARGPLIPPDPAAFRAALAQITADATGSRSDVFGTRPDGTDSRRDVAGARPAAAWAPGPVTAALLRHELAALLLRVRLADPAGERAHVESRTFERFRVRLEEGYPSTRRVEDYAAELGCSVRTLTRASLALTGRTAKQVVDDRVALQARRLLAATALSVAEVGRILGFGEPTNFGRFFHRETGLSPGQFRARFTVDRPAGIPGQRRPSD